MKALVIEDSATGLKVVGNQLERMGITPILTRDGAAGLAAFQEQRPDIVLLDVVMPGMDGYEVARRIRALEHAGEWTPIIFLTSRTADEDLELGIGAGGDDYLFKPVSEVVLAAKVRAMQRILQMRYSLLVLTRKLDQANQTLTRLTSQDGLTGIANRRHFDETLMREWRRAARNHRPVALILVDVDAFKQYNDTYGHLAGDECLKAVAAALQAQVRRPSDLVCRYGGEEFAIILPETDSMGAELVAHGVCEAVRRLRMTHVQSPAADVVTISAGLASVVPPASGDLGPEWLIAMADEALYEAKGKGRNRLAINREVPITG